MEFFLSLGLCYHFVLIDWKLLAIASAPYFNNVCINTYLYMWVLVKLLKWKYVTHVSLVFHFSIKGSSSTIVCKSHRYGKYILILQWKVKFNLDIKLAKSVFGIVKLHVTFWA